MYLTMRAFKKAFNDVILSRRAIHNMNTWYPDATPEELAATDNVSCKSDYANASNATTTETNPWFFDSSAEYFCMYQLVCQVRPQTRFES